MSWLRDHFYRFVFPAFIAAEKVTNDIGEPYDPKAPESAPKHLPTELRKLWGLCQEYKVEWSYDIREHTPWGSFGGSSVFRKTAQLHSRILRNTLSSAVAAMRLEGCTKLMLGGRDVWTLAVIAERRGVPYLFVPELSRKVSECPEVKDFLISLGFTGDELFVDTGFVGSIPACLAEHFGRRFKFRLMSQSPKLNHKLGLGVAETDDAIFDVNNVHEADGSVTTHLLKGYKKHLYKGPHKLPSNRDRHPNQLFPNRKNARAEALETEYLAKYWKTGTVQHKLLDRHIVQYFATRENIQRAALLTSMLWRGVDSYVPRNESAKTTTPRGQEPAPAW